MGGTYEVSYTPEVHGRHMMIVKVNGTQISGSPFQVFAKSNCHPAQLGKPVRVVEGVNKPWGIALNSKQQLVVAEYGKKVTVFDKNGEKVQTVTCEKFSRPIGVAVDKEDNIYVSDCENHSLFKFSKEGKLVKVVGRKGTQPAEFDNLGMIKIIKDKLYICDRGNNRFQVMNTKLEYVNSFGCHGSRGAEFHIPNDIAQDGEGRLYASDYYNHRVQVFDYKGQFLFAFSKKGASKQLCYPDVASVLVLMSLCMYVTLGTECVSVFKTSGKFVTSFGQFSPTGIVIDDDGFVYVADYDEGRINIL